MSSISIPFPNKLAFGFSRYLNSTAPDKPRRNRHIRRQLTTTDFENSDLNFATTIVHEVRNPLSNIYLAIEMLQSEIIDSELKMYLEIIKRSATRINSVVNNLLNKRSSEDAVAEYSIHDLLDEVLESAKDSIGLKKIGVKKEYGKHDHFMQVDRMKMSIGLTNIVVNAVEAMEMGKGDLSVTTKSKDGTYVIEIADNGCGISEENLKNIFKPYYTNKPGGLGLGLASIRDILHSNHVNLKVESAEGEGTRFILSFAEMQSSCA